MASRVGASLLKACDMDELICDDLTEYENLAVDLAVNADRYIKLRSKLEDYRQTCPLFDLKKYVLNLERGYEAMWRRYEQKLEPDHIKIIDLDDEGGGSDGDAFSSVLSTNHESSNES